MYKDRKNRKKIYSTPNYWDTKAEHYNDKSVSMWPNNNLNVLYDVEQKELIDSFINDLKDKYIIDIGCGTGRMSQYFAHKGAIVYAIDFSEKSIDIAKQQNANKNITYQTLSVFQLDYTKHFDIAFTWGVLAIACQNETEVINAIKKIYNSLKEGGELLMLEPIHSSFLHRVLKMDLNTFLGLLENEGFKVVAVKQLNFWPIRILLSYFTIPMFITKPIYWIGQYLMKLFPNSGDYKLIYAKK